MIRIDDRNKAQRKTHRLAVIAAAPEAPAIKYRAWAISGERDLDPVYNWVKSRAGARKVIIAELDEYRLPKGVAQLHIRPVTAIHPALRGE